MKRYILLFLLTMLLIYGCSIKTYNINSSLTLDNATALVKKFTPQYCNYRGRASVKIKAQQNISFTVLLNKKCNEEVLINVFDEIENLLYKILPKKTLQGYGAKEEDLDIFTDNVITKQGRLMGNAYIPLDRDTIYNIYKSLY